MALIPYLYYQGGMAWLIPKATSGISHSGFGAGERLEPGPRAAA